MYYLLAVVAGAFTVSFFEYRFKYNLIDLIVEKVRGIFYKTESSIKKDINKL